VWTDHLQVIQTHAAQQTELVKEGKRTIVGVNRYVNKTDSAVVDERAHTLSAPFEKA
jgi:methylmalonyl-CoA mutase N-terminal domain/subunit